MVYNCIFSFLYVLYKCQVWNLCLYWKRSLRYLSNFKDKFTFLGIQGEYFFNKIKSNHRVTVNFQYVNPEFFHSDAIISLKLRFPLPFYRCRAQTILRTANHVFITHYISDLWQEQNHKDLRKSFFISKHCT